MSLVSAYNMPQETRVALAPQGEHTQGQVVIPIQPHIPPNAAQPLLRNRNVTEVDPDDFSCAGYVKTTLRFGGASGLIALAIAGMAGTDLGNAIWTGFPLGSSIGFVYKCIAHCKSRRN